MSKERVEDGRLTLSLGSFESLHIALLLPRWNTKRETTLAHIRRRWLGNRCNESIDHGRANVASCALDPFKIILRAAFSPRTFKFIFVVVTIRVIDWVIVITVASSGNTLFNVEYIGLIAIRDSSVFAGASHLRLFHGVTSCTKPSKPVVVLAAVGDWEFRCSQLIFAVVIIEIATCANVIAVPRSLNAELVADWFANINFHLRVPVWNKLDPLGIESSGSVDVL